MVIVSFPDLSFFSKNNSCLKIHAVPDSNQQPIHCHDTCVLLEGTIRMYVPTKWDINRDTTFDPSASV